MRGDPKDSRIVKLPNWVQDLIYELTVERDRALKAAEDARLLTKPEDSDTFIPRTEHGDIGLGIGTNVAFRLGTSEPWYDVIQARVEDGTLIVHGGSRVSIYPRSSNAFNVRLDS